LVLAACACALDILPLTQRDWITPSLAFAAPPCSMPLQGRLTRVSTKGSYSVEPRYSAGHARRTRTKVQRQQTEAVSRHAAWHSKPVAWLTAVAVAVKRVACHRLRVPAKRAQSPLAEVFFGAALYGTIRAAVRAYASATDSFKLRDELFQEMAVAHTYKNSVWPWIESGIIALIASIVIVVGVRTFIKSMKEWEQREDLKEMNAMGEDGLFLMSTTVDATPVDKKKKALRRRSPWVFRQVGNLADFLWLFRVGACVGYLLPLLNVLDFGEISISLYPYALGVPPSEPIVNFMQTKLKLSYLYNAYLKSGYYFLIVWFLFIHFAVRNPAMPFFLRFHSSQAILISMLLGVPQQIFFAVLNPWESGLVVQTIMYHSMVSLFIFILMLVIWCCFRALTKKTMKMPLVSEAATMWAGAGREHQG